MTTLRRTFLGLHVSLVVLVVGYLLLTLTVPDSPDADIGFGLALLALGALALPWSTPLLFDGSVSIDSTAYVALVVGGTALNLGLHVLAWRLTTGWRARAAGPPPRRQRAGRGRRG